MWPSDQDLGEGPALPPTDDRVGAEIQVDDNVDVGGGFGAVRLYRR